MINNIPHCNNCKYLHKNKIYRWGKTRHYCYAFKTVVNESRFLKVAEMKPSPKWCPLRYNKYL